MRNDEDCVFATDTSAGSCGLTKTHPQSAHKKYD